MVEHTRMVFRRGIELVRNGSEWRLSTGESIADISALSPSCGATPVVVETTFESGPITSTTSLMLPTMAFYSVEVSSLLQYFAEPDLPDLFLKWKEIIYLLSAMEYHCGNIAQAYAMIRTAYVRVSRIPGFGDHDQTSFGGKTDIVWYEFDALLGAARRTLDISRFALWKAYGKGSVPSNFRNTLGRCNTLPEALRTQLNETWARYGAKLTEYRDCIHHNTSLTRGLGDVSMDKRGHGVWLVSAILPDNPGCKSQQGFTYTQNLDMLEYGYKITMELLEAMKAIAIELVSRRRQIKNG